MAFKDSFHEVVPGYRVNGDVMVFAIKGVKEGGLCDGRKVLEIGNFGIGHRTLIEVEDAYLAPAGYVGVPDVDYVYDQLVLAGMSTVVEGALVNPSSVALLQYSDQDMVAEAVGSGGQFKFVRSKVSAIKYGGNNTWQVPDGDFIAFRDLALQRLSTVLDIAGQAANAYIHFDGSNDYVEFSGTADGLLDWAKDWTVGINLVEFEVRSDGKFITLFSSGQNAIMLRRGGSNHGLYITGNDGDTKVGVNTWATPNPGGKLLFTYDGESATGTPRLKYYIGNVDGSYSLRGNYGVKTANIGGNTVGSEFSIGKRVKKNAVAESLNYVGGLNNFIYADEAMAGPNIAEYFGVNNTYDEAGFYGDLNSWVRMGEDTYPDVVDSLGALTNGKLFQGTEDDFVEIPE